MALSNKWTDDLIQSAHEPGLKRAVVHIEHHVGKTLGHPHKDAFEIIHNLRDELKSGALMALEAGRSWTRSFMPKDHEKTSGFFDWDLDTDIREILKSIHEAPSRQISDSIHEALAKGQHPGSVVGKLLKEYQVDRARDIARTVLMNTYAKGSLREMDRHGYEHAIRMEIDDKKVCPTCKGLNGQVYLIKRLVSIANPLTADTHPRCRGTFIPVINPDLVKPDAPGTIKHSQSFLLSNKKMIKDAPVEYASILKRTFDRSPLPFNVVFNPKLQVDSRLGPETLEIRPQTLIDQDPRELILEAWANRLWPKYQDRFTEEYMLMTRMGLVHPSKTVKTTRDYWRSEFVAYKLHQLDKPYEVLWFKSTLGE